MSALKMISCVFWISWNALLVFEFDTIIIQKVTLIFSKSVEVKTIQLFNKAKNVIW